MSLENEWKKFIRPPRFTYSYFDLGPDRIALPHGHLNRIELTVTNRQSHQLQVSYFQVSPPSSFCILYCHGFNGCRVEGVKYAYVAAQYGINFCTFDFQACGQSEGEYITFGHLEKEDITTVMQHLQSVFNLSSFILWGRSLGATTIQLKQQRPVAGYVLDSCFTDLNKLAVRMVQKQTSLPKFIIKSLMYLVRGKIEGKAKFRFEDIRVQANSAVPTLYICSDQDSLIKSKNSFKLYQAHRGERKMLKVEGEHNDCRPQELIQEICRWCQQLFYSTRSQSEHLSRDVFNKYQYLIGRNSICRSPNEIMRKYETAKVEMPPPSQRYERTGQVLNILSSNEFHRSNNHHNPAKNLKNQIQSQLRVSTRSVRKPIFH